MSAIRVGDFVEAAATSPLVDFIARAPWELTQNAEAIVRRLIGALAPDYRVIDGVALHSSATIETGAILKGPAIIGPDCYVAANAYVRGGCWLGARVTLGPSAELKVSCSTAPSSRISTSWAIACSARM